MTTIPRPAVFVRLALLALALCGAQPALSADPTGQYVRINAAGCTSCHGPSGRAPEGSTIPSLAGRPQAELVAQMQAFRSGTRPATVMHQIARGYTDEQLAAIAAWFANVR
ncbi:c-type cytochrome [Cupriavidus sp. IK-TO18]|uniref:c-type cytochrome n=1 Tax=unclassified Cupriavidus TaxID=2640874 RepID=UPI001897CDBF|nr:c-type cytochrome [Cupriavidus sp. IK-TO18]MBF6986442.1 c-type cytochrome [Cupriavidus sp. IK-TO18]